MIQCHNHDIDMLTLSDDSTILATASVNGRNIKIFDIEKGGLLIQTVRRGITCSTIYQLSIHPQKFFIMAASQAGTIHIFKLVCCEMYKNL
jgi:WD40 repeat protein